MSSIAPFDPNKIKERLDDVRAALAAEDDKKIDEGVEKLNQVVLQVPPEHRAQLQQYLEKDAVDVIPALAEKKKLTGWPADLVPSIATDAAETRTVQERPVGGAMFNGAGVEAALHEKMSGGAMPAPEPVVKAEPNKDDPNPSVAEKKETAKSIDAFLDGVVAEIGVPGVTSLLEAYYQGLGSSYLKKDRTKAEALLARAKAAEQNFDFQAAALDSPIFRDALHLLQDQNDQLSPRLQKSIVSRAAKMKSTPDAVCDGLKGEMKEGLAKCRAEIAEQVAKGLHTDTSHPAVKDLPPELVRLAESGNEAAKRIAEAVKAGKRPDPKDWQSVIKTLQDVPPLTGTIDTSKIQNPEIKRMLDEYNGETVAYDRFCKQNYDQIMAVINSGMPIEAVVMIVMMLVGERSEEKLKRKMKEMALSEALEKSAEVQSGQIKLADLGLRGAQTMYQEMQFEQMRWSQMMNALSAILKSIEEMINTPIRNFR